MSTTIIKTELSARHLELIKLFFNANDLPGVVVDTYNDLINGYNVVCIQLSYEETDYDTSSKITFMAIIHCGVANMLDDFLLKCGVDVRLLRPRAPGVKLTDEDIDANFLRRVTQKVI